MDLGPKHYLLIYALVVIPIAISFFFLRRGRTPVKLNLKNESEPREPIQKPQNEVQAGPRRFSTRQEEPTIRALNVFFQWNGHTWDAYETLGVPAGSSHETVTAAYQKAVAQGDSESMLFFKAAYEAIIRTHA